MKETKIIPFVGLVKFFYPKTQKPVSLVYLIFGILLLLFYGVALYSLTDQILNPSTSYFELLSSD
uniref:hypothetical protein n=1 Tax=Roseivirga sp. TaxID=1964215 RepID=UPI00404857FA